MNFNAAFMIIHHLDSAGFYILIFSLFIFILLFSDRLKDKMPKTNKWILSHEDSANPPWCLM